MKRRLDDDHASKLIEQIRFADRLVYMTTKPTIEAYGWSSPSGKIAEKFRLTNGRLKNFSRIYFEIENHSDYMLNENDNIGALNNSVSTEKGLSHQLSIEAHYLIGANLYLARTYMQRVHIDLSKKIGKGQKLARYIVSVVPKIDGLRSALDSQYLKEYNPGKFGEPIIPYYPGSGRGEV